MSRSYPALRTLTVALLAAAVLSGCSDSDAKPNTPAPEPRTYRMGFSGIPPRPDLNQAIAAVNMWIPRSDQALILNEPPWDSLLAGVPADTLIRRDQLQLAQYYRARGLEIVVSIDPTNGLNRASDSEPLVAAGRSLIEPEIQQLFRDYVVAADTLIRPEYLSVASETNLIRLAASPSLYAALVQNAADAAAAIRAVDPDVKIFTTVQVETAWGRLGGFGGAYEGIAQDRADFPFIQMLGLSSYPYLAGFAVPESIPENYYSRLVESAPIPVMVIEGGWSSVTLDTIVSSPEEQRRYLLRQAEILDRAGASGIFQITFTDLDPSFFPPGTILPFFAHLGLVDADLNPKPALSAWDSIFARPLAGATATAVATRPGRSRGAP